MATLRTSTVFVDENFTLTAIESLDVHTGGTDDWGYWRGSLKPIAVIVREPDRTYALDMTGQPVDTDQLDLPNDLE